MPGLSAVTLDIPLRMRIRLAPAHDIIAAMAFAIGIDPAMAASTSSTRMQPVRYVLDPVHTRALFLIDHAGFSNAIGVVSGATGELWFAPDGGWAGARVQASVPLTRIDLGEAEWNRAVQGKRLLNTEKHPTADFISSRIEPIDHKRAKIHGILTLHGVAQAVTLDTTLNAARRHPLPPFRRTLGFSATTALSRKQFGITAWPSVIGNRVELRIEVEAVYRGRHDGADATAGRDSSTPQPPALPLPTSPPSTASEPAGIAPNGRQPSTPTEHTP